MQWKGLKGPEPGLWFPDLQTTMTNSERTLRNWRDVIMTDPGVLAGKPVIAQTRVPVELVLELLANGWTEDEIKVHYDISPEQIHACLAYAREVVQNAVLFTISVK